MGSDPIPMVLNRVMMYLNDVTRQFTDVQYVDFMEELSAYIDSCLDAKKEEIAHEKEE